MKDLRTAMVAGFVFAVLSSAAYFLQFNEAIPRVLRDVLSVIGLASFPGLVPGALLGGLLEGHVHGAESAISMLVFAVPINFVLFAIVIFIAVKLVRRVRDAVRAPSA